MRIARERPNLLPLVVEVHRFVAQNGNRFSGRDVSGAAQWPTSNLLPLSERGVIKKLDDSAADGGAFYRLVAPLGVERALRELALL
jgi:hypothetical protein